MDYNSIDESEDTDTDNFESGIFHTFSSETPSTVRRRSSVVLYQADHVSRAVRAARQSNLFIRSETSSNYTFKDNSATEYSEDADSASSIRSSTLQSGIEDSSFFAITGIYGINSLRSSSSGSALPPLPETRVARASGAPTLRCRYSARCASSRTLVTACPRLPGLPGLRSRAVATQSEIAGHEPRHVFERKVRSAFPERGRPPPSSNVFILLTDATGQTVFAVNTKTSKKKPRAPDRDGDGLDVEDKRKLAGENNMRSNNSRKPRDSIKASGIRNSASPLMLNISTQTTDKRWSLKRNEKSASPRQKACAFCMEEFPVPPAPVHSRERRSEAIAEPSDSVIFHYKTRKEKFDLSKESVPGVEVEVAHLLRTDSDSTSYGDTSSDFSTEGTEEDTHPIMVANGTQVNNHLSFSRKGGKTTDPDNLRNDYPIQEHFFKTKAPKLDKEIAKDIFNAQKKSDIKTKSTVLNRDEVHTNKSKNKENEPESPEIISKNIQIPKNNDVKTIEQLNDARNDASEKRTSKFDINIDAAREFYNVSIEFSGSRHENLTIRRITKKDHPLKYNSNVRVPMTAEQMQPMKQAVIDETFEDKFPVKIKLNTEGVGTSAATNFENNDVNSDLGVTSSSSEEFANLSMGLAPQPKQYVALLDTHPSVSSDPPEAAAARPAMRQATRHYRGDDCQLPDPLERDREICRLLGVERRRTTSASKSQPGWPSMFYGERKHFIRNMSKKSSSSPGRIGIEKNEEKTLKNKTLQCELGGPTCSREQLKSDAQSAADTCRGLDGAGKPNNVSQCFSQELKPRACKHKPIRISQSEYRMIKRTLHRKPHRFQTEHRLIKKSRVIVRKNSFSHYLKPQVTTVNYMKANYKHQFGSDLRKQQTFYCKSCCNIKANTALYQLNVETQTLLGKKRPNLCCLGHVKKKIVLCNTDCSVLTLQQCRRNRHRNSCQSVRACRPPTRRNAISSTELYERKTSHFLPATYSLCSVRRVSEEDSSTPNKWTPSVFTLYKGKKQATRRSPNFGTSTCTLCGPSTERDHEVHMVDSRNVRKNKSFFKKLLRLISKKKSKDAACQMVGEHRGWGTVAPVDTPDSSFDSYHIGSSLEGIELSSSIYDTSVSHFSQHTTIPIITKNKGKRSVAKKIKKYLKKN